MVSDRKLIGKRNASKLQRVAEALKPRQSWFVPEHAVHTSMKWWPLAFHNNGRHLFLCHGEPRFISAGEQRRISHLPFKQFCRGGNCNGVEFRHLGHLDVINDGPATIELRTSGAEFLLKIDPNNTLWVFENVTHVYIFGQRCPMILMKLIW